MQGKTIDIKDYIVTEEPYYEPVGNEIEIFEMAFRLRRPLALLGPTGCGKTALATYMAYKLRKDIHANGASVLFPYIEVPCHEDLTVNDLVGRHGFDGIWQPGPLYLGAKHGGIVLLDEVVEARKDAIVMIHSLADDRRHLPVVKNGEVLVPPEHFMLVVCYNPGYQIKSKDLKPSTRQRFVTLEMDYPSAEIETKILCKKTGIDEEQARYFVALANNIRKGAKENNELNLQEGASTRLLVMASEFYQEQKRLGKEPDIKEIAAVTIFNPISSEDTNRRTLEEMLSW